MPRGIDIEVNVRKLFFRGFLTPSQLYNRKFDTQESISPYSNEQGDVINTLAQSHRRYAYLVKNILTIIAIHVDGVAKNR